VNYCSHCGENVSLIIPEGDQHQRHVCNSCGMIHYQNPKIVAGVLPTWGDQVLLCRRAIEPRKGLWTLPAGFMENKETVAEAASRETYEEATATIKDIELYTVISLPHISQVYMLYRGELAERTFSPGIESLETQLFDEADIPWDSLAFLTIKKTLECFFKDRNNGVFPVHNLTILRPNKA